MLRMAVFVDSTKPALILFDFIFLTTVLNNVEKRAFQSWLGFDEVAVLDYFPVVSALKVEPDCGPAEPYEAVSEPRIH